MLDAEALLLVDDHEPQVFEPDVPGQEPVGSDDDVDRAGGQPRDRLLRLLLALEARELGQAHGEPGEALLEGLVVLGDEQRGGHEDRHLFAVLDGFEGGAQGDLGLAVADVPGDEPVHGDGFLHVGLDLVDGVELVGSLDVGEGILQFALPGRVG